MSGVLRTRIPVHTLNEDAACFLGFHLLDQMIVKTLGHKVPIISTEGGPVIGWKDDRRYPRLDPFTHAQWVVAINDFLQGGREIHGLRSPDNYFTMCHWLIGNYRMGFISPGWESQSWYTDWWNDEFKLRGELPVVAAVKAMTNLPVDGAKLAVVAGAVLRADNDAPLSGLTVVLLSGDQEVASTRQRWRWRLPIRALVARRLRPLGLAMGCCAPGCCSDAGADSAGNHSPDWRGRQHFDGPVQSASGVPLSGIAVTLSRDGLLVAETNTSADGSFRFGGLPLGAYRLAVPGITVAGLALDGWQSKNLKLTAGAPAGYRYAVSQSASAACGRDRQPQRILRRGQRRERDTVEWDQGTDGLAWRRVGQRVSGDDHGARSVQTGRKL